MLRELFGAFNRAVAQRLILVAALVASAPGRLDAANVTVNAGQTLSTVENTVFGVHTSVYDNQHGNPALPGRLRESGVNTLRYPGGGYSDVYHWSVHKLSPFWGQAGNYGYLGPSTDFGHFVQLLSNAQAQSVITVNFGSGQLWNAAHTQLLAPGTNAQPQEAAAWVAYANGDASLYGTANDISIGVDALGNDWKTAGFWAKLRTSTPAQYQSWAGTDYSPDHSFLAINRAAPVGVRHWEIGNETFGTGYYDGNITGFSVNYAVAYDGSSRLGKTNLSPAVYGRQVSAFAQAMKAIDPTIKIGAVVSTPPGDYNWDSYAGQRWSDQVLQQCATNVDFVIAHWYPYAGENAQPANLLAAIRTTLPRMVNGTTTNLDSGTSAGLRDWIKSQRPADATNVQIFITEFGYFGSLTNSIRGPGNALFAGDSYATWMDLGVANVDILEMSKTPFVGDSSALTRGAAFYAIQMVRRLAGPGDRMVSANSDQSLLRVHASVRQGGEVGLLLINEDLANSQTVNVTITNAILADAGTRYQFGIGNFPANNETPSSPPSTNGVVGLNNSFAVTVPAFTMVVLTVPSVTNSAPTLAAMSNWVVNVGQTVEFTASASDPDSPGQTLAFSLLDGPTNATVDSATGQFLWRPPVTAAGASHSIIIQVADDGTPSMSATQSFTTTVNPLTPPTLSPAVPGNDQFALAINGDTGPDYAVQASSNMVDWTTLIITNAPSMPFQWIDPNGATLPLQFYRVKAGPPLP